MWVDSLVLLLRAGSDQHQSEQEPDDEQPSTAEGVEFGSRELEAIAIAHDSRREQQRASRANERRHEIEPETSARIDYDSSRSHHGFVLRAAVASPASKTTRTSDVDVVGEVLADEGLAVCTPHAVVEHRKA